MYETWFRFTQRPFTTAPQLSDYFAASAVEAAVRTIGRCIGRGSGPAVLVGPPGTGKTVLSMKLHATFCSRMPTANICCSGLGDRRSFLQAVLFEFGRPYRQLDDGELRLSLVDYLTSRDATHNGALCILDDAHFLPTEALDEIRMLSNLVRNGKWCAHLVLTGTSLLEECLHTPQMESFQQRIAARCYLEPFRREETIGYVRQSISRANGNVDQIFAADALACVHELTRGIPRLINQVCDHALLLAAIGHHHQLAATGVDEAWRDLQQLPDPAWETAPMSVANVVEFGSLDVEPSEVVERPVAEETLAFTSGGTEELWQGPSPIDRPHFPISQRNDDTHFTFQDDGSDAFGNDLDDAWDPPMEHLADEFDFDESQDASGDLAPEASEEFVPPDNRLTEIEEKLASLTEELSYAPHKTPSQPATETSVLPMVAENPFLDEFDTEELVIDRMGSLRHAAIFKHPAVVTRETRELVSELGPCSFPDASCESASFTLPESETEVAPLEDVLVSSDAGLSEAISIADEMSNTSEEPTENQSPDEFLHQSLDVFQSAEPETIDDIHVISPSDPHQQSSLDTTEDIASRETELSEPNVAHPSAPFIPLVTWGRSYDIPIVTPSSLGEVREEVHLPADAGTTAATLATPPSEDTSSGAVELVPAASSSNSGPRRFGKLFASLQTR